MTPGRQTTESSFVGSRLSGRRTSTPKSQPGTSQYFQIDKLTEIEENNINRKLIWVSILFVSTFFMTPPFKEWWRGIKGYPCQCVRLSVIKIWCPLNNFWKTASIQFKFGMLIYNIKTQIEFDFGYNPLIFDRVMGLL